jgi:hypothetical protein
MTSRGVNRLWVCAGYDALVAVNRLIRDSFTYPLKFVEYSDTALLYTNLHWSQPMRPFALPDGHDAPRLVCAFVPRLAAVVDDIVMGGKHPVG